MSMVKRIVLFIKIVISFVCFFVGNIYANHEESLIQHKHLLLDNSLIEVQIGVAALPINFYPYSDRQLDAQYAHLFFDPLVRWSVDKKIELRLVQQWSQLAPGVTRFHLKDNIIFHSGNPLTSNDILWTLVQIRLQTYANEFFAKIQSIKKVDKYTFDIYSELPTAQLLDYLTHFFVLDKKFYEQQQINLPAAQSNIPLQQNYLVLSGTGPYQVKQYNPLLHLRVAHFSHYWGGIVNIEGFNFIKIRSVDSRLFALLADDIEVAESVAKKNIDTVHFAPSKSLVEVDSSNVIFLTINDKRSDVLKRNTVREALRLSINEAGMLKHIANGLGSVNKHYIPLQQVDASETDNVVEYDLSSAKYILSKVDMPSQLSLLVMVDPIGNTPQVAKALVNMFKRIGLSLQITEVTSLQKWNELFSEYDFSLSTWQSPLLDSDNIYQNLFTHSTLSVYLDELFKENANSHDLRAKISLYQQAEKEHRVIPLLFLNKIWATDEKFKLSNIFSVNSIPYWHLLRKNEIK